MQSISWPLFCLAVRGGARGGSRGHRVAAGGGTVGGVPPGRWGVVGVEDDELGDGVNAQFLHGLLLYVWGDVVPCADVGPGASHGCQPVTQGGRGVQPSFA